MRRTSRRALRRALTTAALTPAVLLGLLAVVQLPASADIGDHYTPDPMHLAPLLGVFVGIPLAVIIIAAILSMHQPSRTGALRYRPGRPWGFSPVWFGARPDESPDRRPKVAVPGAGGASGSW